LNCSNDPVKIARKRAGRLLDGLEWNEYPKSFTTESTE